MSGCSAGRITRLPSPDSASSSAPVPGSLPIETYAATVAARRTSGRSVSTAANPCPASTTSTSGRRCRDVWIRSRNAIFATAAADAGSLPDRDWGGGTGQAYDRSHEQRRTRPCPGEDGRRGYRPRRDRHLRPLLPPPRARRDRPDPRVHDRTDRHGGARRRRRRRRGSLRRAAHDRRDQAERRPRHLDGHGPRQEPALRPQGLVVPRRDRPPGAPPEAHPRRPAAADLHEQLPHLQRHHGRARPLRRPAGRRPAPGVPAEPRAEAPLHRPVAGQLPQEARPRVVPARPRRPLHRAAGHRAAPEPHRPGLRAGLRVQLRQPRRGPSRHDRGLVRRIGCPVRDRGRTPYPCRPQGRTLRPPEVRRPDRPA